LFHQGTSKRMYRIQQGNYFVGNLQISYCFDSADRLSIDLSNY